MIFIFRLQGRSFRWNNSIQGDAYEREVGNLKKFVGTTTEPHRYVIVTYEEEKIIDDSDIKIEVVPLMKFLLKG